MVRRSALAFEAFLTMEIVIPIALPSYSYGRAGQYWYCQKINSDGSLIFSHWKFLLLLFLYACEGSGIRRDFLTLHLWRC